MGEEGTCKGKGFMERTRRENMEVALTREEAWQMETMEISNRMTGLKGKRSLPVNIQP